jgi:hypothetical protein
MEGLIDEEGSWRRGWIVDIDVLYIYNICIIL